MKTKRSCYPMFTSSSLTVQQVLSSSHNYFGNYYKISSLFLTQSLYQCLTTNFNLSTRLKCVDFIAYYHLFSYSLALIWNRINKKHLQGRDFDQFAHSGKEGVPQSMCTIINCSKVNSSLLLSKDSLPTKHLRSSKLFQFVTTPAPKPWGKSLYILDLCILETTTCWQGESLRKVLKQFRFLCTPLSRTGCCSCLQSASSTMEDLGQQQELSARIQPL